MINEISYFLWGVIGGMVGFTIMRAMIVDLLKIIEGRN